MQDLKIWVWESNLNPSHILSNPNIQNPILDCPVLTPTYQEFRDFSAYVEKIEAQYAPNFGMVKIRPPAEWKPRSSPYEESLQNLIIKNPIEQNPEGKGGIYQFKHICLPSVSYQSYVRGNESKQLPLQDKSPEQIQALFWKSIPYSPPVYGADLVGTLMDQSAGTWFLDNLDTVLNRGLDCKLRGVNNSYCYIGSWKSLFCWHKEDLDLSAINYLHFGKPKFWYCIQNEDGQILERQAKKYFFSGFEKCPQYLRHKTSLINPYLLHKRNPSLRITKTMQSPNEFIIAFGGSYHCGFNFGVNVAEAVNYGTIKWIEKLKKCEYCICRKSAVRASFEAIIEKLKEDEEIARDQTFQAIIGEIYQPSQGQREEFYEEEENKETKKVDPFPQKHKKIVKARKKGSKQANSKEKSVQTQVQCDDCGQWHLLPQKMATIINDIEFYCKDAGKLCQFQPNQHNDH